MSPGITHSRAGLVCCSRVTSRPPPPPPPLPPAEPLKVSPECGVRGAAEHGVRRACYSPERRASPLICWDYWTTVTGDCAASASLDLLYLGKLEETWMAGVCCFSRSSASPSGHRGSAGNCLQVSDGLNTFLTWLITCGGTFQGCLTSYPLYIPQSRCPIIPHPSTWTW